MRFEDQAASPSRGRPEFLGSEGPYTRLRERPIAVGIFVGLLILGAVAAWPPAVGATLPGGNGSVAYYRYAGQVPVIRSVTPDGAVEHALTSSGLQPAWSASGSRIAFADGDELFTMAADGTGRSQLTHFGAPIGAPAWSPDDTRIAFAARDANFNWDVWAIDVTGANPRNLTNQPGQTGGPSWSPDGTKLAFVTQRDGDAEIYVMNADGSNQTNLTKSPASFDSAPDWSPDGSRILFSSSGRGADPGIYIMDSDGSHVARLNSGREFTWSPDGRLVAFTDSSVEGVDLFTMKPDGTGVTQVTQDGDVKYTPDWQPLRPSSLTSTVVASPNRTIVYGDEPRFTSAVTSSGPPPTGVVQFRVNGVNEGAPVALDPNGRAEYLPPFLLDVGDAVSGTYGGDARWGWSHGDAGLSVVPASTVTSLVTSSNPVTTGQALDVVVTVANTSTDITPFGSVQFSIDGGAVGPRLSLDRNGQVALRLTVGVAAGDYQVGADYRDDTAVIADFLPSSGVLAQRVNSPGTPQQATTIQAIVPAVVHPKDVAGFGKLLAQALRTSGFARLSAKGALFAAAAPGTLSQSVYFRPQGSSALRMAARRILVAAGRHTFTRPGSSRLSLRLTSAGKRLIRRAKQLRLEITTSFVPAAGATVSNTTGVTVNRRAHNQARTARGPVKATTRVVLSMSE